ncbi:inositol 2-dehydrogenase [Sediminispirochaeta bajacaliforniensis]|uniref:inositol 2-dehydrogenase n=1 Tax=Sediminispirochaeta bajacaliforniensis TaxID=148 RepID=UPI000364583C|nr:inositol 2-dehydrogenase [Sediminispirochaeta bajacaliforniensis]
MKAKLNLGIIGAGRIGKVHIESITTGFTDVRIKAVADPYLSDETRQWALDRGVEACYKDVDKIIGDDEIDAVLICSSTDTHSRYTMEAARAGKHIFCEKPLDHDLGRIEEALKVVKECGVKFQIGFNRRFDHNFRSLHQAVVDGKVGDVHMVRISSRDPEPPGLDYVKVSGGLFLDMMIHDFDMVRFLSGSEVEEVFAAGAVLVDPAIGKAGDIDTAIVTMKLTNGALAVIDNSRKAVYGYDQRAEVFGSGGAASVGNDSPSTLSVSGSNGVVGEKPHFFFLERYIDAYRNEIGEFIKAVVEDKPTPLGPEDALMPIRIALAAKRSLETGKPEKVR